MYQTRGLAAVVIGLTLFASLTLEGNVPAAGRRGATVQLTPSRDSGVSGTATLTDVEGGVRFK